MRRAESVRCEHTHRLPDNLETIEGIAINLQAEMRGRERPCVKCESGSYPHARSRRHCQHNDGGISGSPFRLADIRVSRASLVATSSRLPPPRDSFECRPTPAG